MAESNGNDHGVSGSNQKAETKEHGCFDFLAKREGKTEHDVVMEDQRKEDKNDLRRLHSQSSSSGDEESEGERKKNKKTSDDSTKLEDINDVEVVDVDEKKGFVKNIKEHLPGKHKKLDENVPTPETTSEPDGKHLPENETKEKKGILEKIKEKVLPKNVDGEIENKKEI